MEACADWELCWLPRRAGLRVACARAGEWRGRRALVRELGRRCHAVVSVVSTGGSNARMDIYQRTTAGWQPLKTGIPTHVGSLAWRRRQERGSGHPMGVYTSTPLRYRPNPGGGLPYTQVGPNHWWSGDDHSPTFNSMQVCQKSQCPFSTATARTYKSHSTSTRS